MPDEETVSQIISRKRPFVLVLMPFGRESNWAQFHQVSAIVKSSVDFRCITANQIEGGGCGIREKVYAAIEQAELVIADVTSGNPNVMHEVGYATAKGKVPLLIRKSKSKVPSNLDGLESIPYGGSADTDSTFEGKLRDHLKSRLSDVGLFKEMLEAEARHPAYIVAQPKSKSAGRKIYGHVHDFRTYGDNLGVLGLISAFGAMWGEPTNVELISADFHSPDLPNDDKNLYLIGSGKVNDLVPGMLERIQNRREPKWEFADKEGVVAPEGDAYIRLYRTLDGRREEKEGKVGTRGPRGRQKKRVFVEDFGILVRGPHPDHQHRMVLIMAGAHSVGTGAACLAATRSAFIRQIKEKLPEGTLADKKRAFWALVKGKLSDDEEGLLDMKGVEIVEVGVYA